MTPFGFNEKKLEARFELNKYNAYYCKSRQQFQRYPEYAIF